MIRKLRKSDIDQVIDIWLEASIEAHAFIDNDFWKSKAEDMKEIYLPSGETYVYEEKGVVKGFMSLCDDTLAALFVSPDSQGTGIGTQLMKKAKDIRDHLKLTVYKENMKAMAFYRKCGFRIEQEHVDTHTGHAEFLMKFHK